MFINNSIPPFTTIAMKSARYYSKDVILNAPLFCVRHAVSYRDSERILPDHGVNVDHATLNRWVVKYAPLIAAKPQAKDRTQRSPSG